MPNLICSWTPDSLGLTVDSNGFVTAVPAAEGTAITLTGVSGACPTLFRKGPQGHKLFQCANGQQFTLSAITETMTAFTVIAVIANSTGGTLIGNTAAGQDILLPAATNSINVRPTGSTGAGTNAVAPLNRGRTPCIEMITWDGTANTVVHGFNNQMGTPVSNSNFSGTIAFNQLFAAGGTGGNFTGLLGPMRIYDYVRSSAQLTQDFTAFANWIAQIFYLSSSQGNDLNPTPWLPPFDPNFSPWATFNQTLSEVTQPGQVIAPRGGDIFREDVDTYRTGIVSGTQAAPVILDGGLWGVPLGNGLSNQPKAEIRHSFAPALTVRSGTVYSAGAVNPPNTATPNASYPGDQVHRSPSFYMYYVPGGRIKFGSQFVNGYPNTILVPTQYAPWSCVCQDLPQYSSNVLAMTQVSYVQISHAASSTGSNGGLVRLTVDSTAEYLTGNSVWVQDVNATVIGATPATGTFTCTVVDATHLDLQGTTFGPGGTVTATFIGGVVNLSRQASPPAGKWGFDSTALFGTANTLYVNAGVPLNTGDIEVPFDESTFIFKFRFGGDWWTIRNIATSLFGVTGPYGGNVDFVCHQTWDNFESYFTGQDNFDVKAGANINITNSNVSFAGFGGNGIAGHDPAGPATNGTGCVINVQNTVCVHNAQSNFGAEYTSRITWNACISVGEGIRHARIGDPASSDGPGTCFVTNSLFYIPLGLVGTTDNANWGYPAAIIHQGAPAHIFAYNNTIVAQTQYPNVTGLWVEAPFQTGAVMVAENNIFYNMTTAVNVEPGATLSADYNMYFLNGAIGIPTSQHDVVKDPQFVKFPSNLHPSGMSPAIAAGQIGLVTTDFSGTARATPPTIGAFEVSHISIGGSSGPAYGQTYDRKVDDEEEAVLALLH